MRKISSCKEQSHLGSRFKTILRRFNMGSLVRKEVYKKIALNQTVITANVFYFCVFPIPPHPTQKKKERKKEKKKEQRLRPKSPVYKNRLFSVFPFCLTSRDKPVETPRRKTFALFCHPRTTQCSK